MKTWYARLIPALALALCGAIATIIWMVWMSPPAKPALDILAGAPTVNAPLLSGVQTYDPAQKKTRKLPTAVVENDRHQVIAATRIEPSERRTEVTAAIDLDTGKATLYERELARPLIEQTGKTEWGAYIGLNQNIEPTLRLQARHEVMRLKAIKLGGMVTVDLHQTGGVDGFAGLGIWGQF